MPIAVSTLMRRAVQVLLLARLDVYDVRRARERVQTYQLWVSMRLLR